jgi:hypothetical protein
MALDAAARQQALWPPRVGSLEWMEAVDRDDQAWAVIRLALAEHQPGITDAEARRLADACSQGELGDLAGALFWGLDPKALRPAVDAAGPSPTTPPPGATTGTG